MVPNLNSPDVQKPSPLAVFARISGSRSLRTCGDPRLGTTDLEGHVDLVTEG